MWMSSQYTVLFIGNVPKWPGLEMILCVSELEMYVTFGDVFFDVDAWHSHTSVFRVFFRLIIFFLFFDVSYGMSRTEWENTIIIIIIKSYEYVHFIYIYIANSLAFQLDMHPYRDVYFAFNIFFCFSSRIYDSMRLQIPMLYISYIGFVGVWWVRLGLSLSLSLHARKTYA